MRERYFIILLIILGIMILVDLYSFKGLKLLTKDLNSQQTKTIIHWTYWGVSGLFLFAMAAIFLKLDVMVNPLNSSWSFLINSIIMMMVLSKLVFSVFHLADDVLHLLRKGGSFLFNQISNKDLPGEPISRMKFLTYVGAAFFTISLGSIGYGIFRGRFAFRVLKEKLGFSHLPKSFNGFRIVQISDIHIGSFPKYHPSVAKAIETINNLKPDVIFFTGDLVNNVAPEMEGWDEIFNKLEAPYGKFSILGNHDYGDYYQWPNLQVKKENLDEVKKYHAKMGFDLLLNENRTIEKEGEKIHLIGVENWGKPPFVQYGDLAKARQNVPEEAFKLLLSHDPSHWDEQVIGKTNIDITFSGHTHGMQFGIEIPGIKWSPVKYKYPRWGGLYNVENQYLYVNRGFGHIGFAGRVGMPPEITVIDLENKA